MIRRANEREMEVRNQVRGGIGDAVFAHVWKSAEDGQLNKNMRLYSVITLKEGDSIGYHVHEKEDELYFILSGNALYDDNGVKCELAPGDSTITKSGQGHSVMAKGSEDLVLLAVIVNC